MMKVRACARWWTESRSPTYPGQNHLSGLAGKHGVERVLKLGEGETVGNDGPNIETGLEHHVILYHVSYIWP